MSRQLLIALILGGMIPVSSAYAADCVERTGESATVILPSSLLLTVDGQAVDSEVEITATTSDDVCAGSASWTGAAASMTLWGDDSQTSTRDGFERGESIEFQIRDVTSGIEYNGENAHIDVEYGQNEPFYRTDGSFAEEALYRLAGVAVTTKPSAPRGVSPADGATGLPTNPDVTWSGSSEAESYQFELATDSRYDDVVDSGAYVDTSIELQHLEYGATYDWRVRSVNSAGTSDWSSTRAFTTIVAPPETSELVAPVDDAADQPVSLELTWREARGAESYRVEVASTDDFSTPVFEAEPTETSAEVAGLADGSTYFWRVRAVNDGGAGNWSSIFAFATSTPPPPAAPAVEDAGVEPGAVTLTWSKTAESYLVQVADNDGFAPLVLEESLSDTVLVASELESGQTYFWRVQARSDTVEGDWSSLQSFTMPPDVLSSTPELEHPMDGTLVDDSLVTLSWHSIDDAASYRVRIYEENDSFERVEIDSSGISGTELEIRLAPGTSYAWEVRGVNVSGPGPWSPLSSFDLSGYSATSTDDLPEMPDAVRLHPNYPDPFNPSTTIRFDVPQSMHVRMVIYDARGAEREILMDSRVTAGRHEMRWEADRYPSGLYIARLEAGGIKKTMTLLLVK